MIVILCHAADGAARWLGQQLQLAGRPVQCITVDELVYARSICYRSMQAGTVSEIVLTGDRRLRSDAISGLINRLQTVPVHHLAQVAESDRGYAVEELSAFLLAWLDSLPCPVVNPARPHCLGGYWRHDIVMRHFAAMAGLAVAPMCFDSAAGEEAASAPARAAAVTIVFDDRTYGAILPRAVQDGARRLARLAEMPLLEIAFTPDAAGQLSFAGAHGLVDFRAGGASLVRAMAAAMPAAGRAA